jgi:hypothetical protein
MLITIIIVRLIGSIFSLTTYIYTLYVTMFYHHRSQPQAGKPPGTLRATVGPYQPRSRNVGIYYPYGSLDSSSRIRLNTSLYQYLSACSNTPHTLVLCITTLEALQAG